MVRTRARPTIGRMRTIGIRCWSFRVTSRMVVSGMRVGRGMVVVSLSVVRGPLCRADRAEEGGMDLLTVPGPTVDAVLLAGAVAAVGALGVVVLRYAPRSAFGLWLLVLCAVPVWAGVSVVVDWEPEVLVTLLALTCLVSLRPRGGA